MTDLIERLYESRFHMLEAADEIERLETLLATAEHNEAHACEAMNLMRARLAEAERLLHRVSSDIGDTFTERPSNPELHDDIDRFLGVPLYGDSNADSAEVKP